MLTSPEKKSSFSQNNKLSSPNVYFGNYLKYPKITQKVETSANGTTESMSGYLPDRYSGRRIEKFNNRLEVTPLFAYFGPNANAETDFLNKGEMRRRACNGDFTII